MEAAQNIAATVRRLEGEINELVGVLQAPGGGGLKGPLVDAEGFPRSDIDVYQTRLNRNKLACLKTDYHSAMKQMEDALHQLHAQQRAGAEQPASEEPSSKEKTVV